MIGQIIARLGLPFLAQILGGAVGRIDHPAARTASKALEDLDGALAGGAIDAHQLAEANRHAERMAELRVREHETIIAEINQSLRAEAASLDPYVRRMRPTFGYFMAVSWAVQMVGLAYIMVFKTDQAEIVLRNLEALSLIWTAGLSVLGIYVYKRSEEKKTTLFK